jgi:hypothetical protein
LFQEALSPPYTRHTGEGRYLELSLDSSLRRGDETEGLRGEQDGKQEVSLLLSVPITGGEQEVSLLINKPHNRWLSDGRPSDNGHELIGGKIAR